MPEAVAAPGHAPGTKGETYIRHHLPELDTKPLLEVRGLKMHFPVTDPHADYEAETRRRNRLAFGRGYRRTSPRLDDCEGLDRRGSGRFPRCRQLARSAIGSAVWQPPRPDQNRVRPACHQRSVPSGRVPRTNFWG
jgi:hypothetical protein